MSHLISIYKLKKYSTITNLYLTPQAEKDSYSNQI